MNRLSLSAKITKILAEEGVNFFVTYPCAKFQSLYNLIHTDFDSIGLTKEEEGVGVCAGASLVGLRPAMLIQSTGLGNMFNALCSLTLTYQLPLMIIASWRGKYQESIPAQLKLGQSLPALLKAIGCKPQVIETRKDLSKITTATRKAYEKKTLQVVLLSPLLWVHEPPPTSLGIQEPASQHSKTPLELPPLIPGSLTRYEIIKSSLPFLQEKIVVSNIGYPSRELYSLYHQPSNFYMLGSLGLASSIGLGITMRSSKSTVVIDGDGSLLANLGSLATIAHVAPPNLTILAIDNGVHGSTGNQPTVTRSCVDLAKTAQGLGLRHVYRGTSKDEIESILAELSTGPNFVHIPAKPGNAEVSTIPLTPLEIKQNFMQAI